MLEYIVSNLGHQQKHKVMPPETSETLQTLASVEHQYSTVCYSLQQTWELNDLSHRRTKQNFLR
jgi:hypothetical protein